MLYPMWQQQDKESFLRSLNFVLYGFQDKRPTIQNGLTNMLKNPNMHTTVRFFIIFTLGEGMLVMNKALVLLSKNKLQVSFMGWGWKLISPPILLRMVHGISTLTSDGTISGLNRFPLALSELTDYFPPPIR